MAREVNHGATAGLTRVARIAAANPVRLGLLATAGLLAIDHALAGLSRLDFESVLFMLSLDIFDFFQQRGRFEAVC